MIQSVGPLCLEHDIKIFDVPEFVYDFQERLVPFDHKKMPAGMPKNLKGLYSNDAKKAINDLPESFSKNLYDFQKKGIAFGL